MTRAEARAPAFCTLLGLALCAMSLYWFRAWQTSHDDTGGQVDFVFALFFGWPAVCTLGLASVAFARRNADPAAARMTAAAGLIVALIPIVLTVAFVGVMSVG